MNWLIQNWQTVAATLAVAVAAMIVLRKLAMLIWRTSSGAGCGSCGSCPHADTEMGIKKTELFQLSDRANKSR